MVGNEGTYEGGYQGGAAAAEERRPNWFQRRAGEFRQADVRTKLLMAVTALLLLAAIFFAVYGATKWVQDTFAADTPGVELIPGIDGAPGAAIEEGSMVIWDNCITPIMGNQGDVFRIVDASGAQHEVTITRAGGVCIDGLTLPKPVRITLVD